MREFLRRRRRLLLLSVASALIFCAFWGGLLRWVEESELWLIKDKELPRVWVCVLRVYANEEEFWLRSGVKSPNFDQVEKASNHQNTVNEKNRKNAVKNKEEGSKGTRGRLCGLACYVAALVLFLFVCARATPFVRESSSLATASRSLG